MYQVDSQFSRNEYNSNWYNNYALYQNQIITFRIIIPTCVLNYRVSVLKYSQLYITTFVNSLDRINHFAVSGPLWYSHIGINWKSVNFYYVLPSIQINILYLKSQKLFYVVWKNPEKKTNIFFGKPKHAQRKFQTTIW